MTVHLSRAAEYAYHKAFLIHFVYMPRINVVLSELGV
jgi:hypothetical protein